MTEKPEVETPWMTVDETAVYMRVSRSTVFRLVSAEILPSSRTSPRGRRRVRKDDVDAYLATLRVATNAPSGVR